MREETPNGTRTPASMVPARQIVEIPPAEALTLLAGVNLGRIVFTLSALPAIRPVNHLVDHGEIIVRTRLTSAISGLVKPTRDPVVAYQADQFDLQDHLGWSVVVTGYARRVTDPAALARYEAALTPWVNVSLDTVLIISAEMVTGFRLVEGE